MSESSGGSSNIGGPDPGQLVAPCDGQTSQHGANGSGKYFEMSAVYEEYQNVVRTAGANAVRAIAQGQIVLNSLVSEVAKFDAVHNHALTRLAGAAQAVGGGGEFLAGSAVLGGGGAATATGVGAPVGGPAMFVGGVTAVNGLDNYQTGLRTALTGEFQNTGISQLAGAVAKAGGASNSDATRVTDGVNLGQNLVTMGPALLGFARKLAGLGQKLADAAQSVRLTGVAINGATRTVPMGFKSEKQFLAAVQDLKKALAKSGINDGTVGVRGSSVTGRSFKKGTVFGPQSDIDLFVESQQLTAGYKTSSDIPGFVHPKKIFPDYPLLQEWSTRWTNTLGREITPGGFLPGTLPDHPAIIVRPAAPSGG